MRLPKSSLVAALLVLSVAAGVLAVQRIWNLSPTDLAASVARVPRAKRATVAAAPPKSEEVPIRAEGRVTAGPLGQVTIGAEATGTVERMFAAEGSFVAAGEPLFALRRAEQLAAVDEASARAREARVTSKFLDQEVKRAMPLLESGAISRQAFDRILFERSAARAKLHAQAASASRLAVTAARMRVVSPIAGTVIARKVEVGETVAAGAPVFVVADLSRLRVTAEVDELDALRIQPSMRATITLDVEDGPSFRAEVEAIASAITPRRIRPQDPTRPTEPQVLEVKLALLDEVPLKLGQRVNVAFQRQSATPVAVASRDAQAP